VRVGDIADRRRVWEAIVAVPFIVRDGQRTFFTIQDPRKINAADQPFGLSVAEQVNKMRKYVFPPAFDFLNNKAVSPIAMAIFEFSHRLTKNDLSHIWQNLPPKVGVVPEEASSTLSWGLFSNELLGDRREQNRTGEVKITGYPDGLKWMVFKVKQKAKNNYYDSLAGKSVEAGKVQIPKYTNNWPYDFCSIVELARLETEVELSVPSEYMEGRIQDPTKEVTKMMANDPMFAYNLDAGSAGITAAGTLYNPMPDIDEPDDSAVSLPTEYSGPGRPHIPPDDDDDDNGGPFEGPGSGPGHDGPGPDTGS
jgi:hypothetical protein